MCIASSLHLSLHSSRNTEQLPIDSTCTHRVTSVYQCTHPELLYPTNTSLDLPDGNHHQWHTAAALGASLSPQPACPWLSVPIYHTNSKHPFNLKTLLAVEGTLPDLAQVHFAWDAQNIQGSFSMDNWSPHPHPSQSMVVI